MHEKNHRDNWIAWWPNGYNSDLDADKDFVPDYLEPDMGLKVFPIKEGKCSCDDEICRHLLGLSIPKPEEYAIDFECLAFKAELDWKVCSADEEDFSDLSRRIYNKNYECK